MGSNPDRLRCRIDDQRAWLGSGIRDAQPWLVTLPSLCWNLIRGAVESWRSGQGAVTDVRLGKS